MRIELKGNLACTASAEWNGELGTVKGKVVCYDDLEAFVNESRAGGLSRDSVPVLRFGDREKMTGQLEECLQTLGAECENRMILSNFLLPEVSGICSVYVKTGKAREQEPYFLMRDGDGVLMDPEERALYLYVADEELRYRSYVCYKDDKRLTE